MDRYIRAVLLPAAEPPHVRPPHPAPAARNENTARDSVPGTGSTTAFPVRRPRAGPSEGTGGPDRPGPSPHAPSRGGARRASSSHAGDGACRDDTPAGAAPNDTAFAARSGFAPHPAHRTSGPGPDTRKHGAARRWLRAVRAAAVAHTRSRSPWVPPHGGPLFLIRGVMLGVAARRRLRLGARAAGAAAGPGDPHTAAESVPVDRSRLRVPLFQLIGIACRLLDRPAARVIQAR